MATEKRLIYLEDAIAKIVDTPSDVATMAFEGYYGFIRNPASILVDRQNEVLYLLEAVPTVDAVEVVRGEWTIIEDDYCGLIGLECSHCEKTWWFDEESPIGEYHFCPGCGADMRERKDND